MSNYVEYYDTRCFIYTDGVGEPEEQINYFVARNPQHGVSVSASIPLYISSGKREDVVTKTVSIACILFYPDAPDGR